MTVGNCHCKANYVPRNTLPDPSNCLQAKRSLSERGLGPGVHRVEPESHVQPELHVLMIPLPLPGYSGDLVDVQLLEVVDDHTLHP